MTDLALYIKCFIVLFMLSSMSCYATERDTPYTTIEWNDLLTEQDIKALMEPPEEVSNIADGSEQDTISNALMNALELADDSDYQRALTSTVVRDEFNGKKIRIAGFIVPINVDDEQNITTFFLVPYYGACIHMPAPPPNQIIYSTMDEPFKLKDIYSPYWVSGGFSTELIENDLARSAYSMAVDTIEDYDE
jgi:hypothetical protein